MNNQLTFRKSCRFLFWPTSSYIMYSLNVILDIDIEKCMFVFFGFGAWLFPQFLELFPRFFIVFWRRSTIEETTTTTTTRQPWQRQPRRPQLAFGHLRIGFGARLFHNFLSFIVFWQRRQRQHGQRRPWQQPQQCHRQQQRLRRRVFGAFNHHPASQYRYNHYNCQKFDMQIWSFVSSTKCAIAPPKCNIFSKKR